MKTVSFDSKQIERTWYLVDAKGATLGRLATRVSHVLRGKHRPEYTPHSDCGDYVVVINAEAIHVTGGKMDKKIYYRHSGYPGGLKQITLKQLMEKKPISAIELAVKGMLPRNPLGRAIFRKLKVYQGSEHEHAAQNPIPFPDYLQ